MNTRSSGQPTRAIVSGGATGVGAAITRRLVQRGYAVRVLDRNEAAATSLVAELRRDYDGDVAFDLVDVGTEAIDDVAREACRKLQGVDLLFNHAGAIVVAPFLETDRATWIRLFAINVLGMVAVTQAVLPWMIAAKRGSIVNTASISGLTASALESAYCVTKGACIQLTRAIAVEFRDQGIRCNAVCPGFIDTPHGRSEMDALCQRGQPLTAEELHRLQGRMCTSEEVAAAAIFLAGEDASFISGETLAVDNAAMART